MKKLLVFVVSSLIAISAFAGTPVSDKKKEIALKNIEQISPEDALANLKGDKNIVLLDVRTDREYEGGHVAGAIWTPRGLLDFKAGKWLKDKSKTYYVYCKTGGRGSISTYDLKQLGYKAVNIKGGYKALKKSGAKVVSGRAKGFAETE
jgi:rhodanese-related sulfurtransferase